MAGTHDFIDLNGIVEKATNKTILLPTVQRGFVWKPYQIENFWDSLLRGYPVGSFVLSKKINSGGYELLDGQQRASAICLGFYNPLNKSNEDSKANTKIFKTSYENIMIFIDLVKPNSNNDNRKYLFRVITKSHPWGYRRQENQKILESNNRAKAMNSYNISNYAYLQKPLKEFWPYDSYKPIPLGLIINAAINKFNIEDLKKSYQEWEKKMNIKVIDKRNEENIPFYSIEEIYNDIKRMLEKQKIPLLLLNLSELHNDQEKTGSINSNYNETDKKVEGSDKNTNSQDEKNENEQRNSEDRNIDEIENLFIRLNSAGTPLRGEELNYSILKSHIKPGLQREIEDNCKGLFYPARFITIAFRLYNNSSDYNSTGEKDSISMRIKPKQFQRIMRESKKDNFIIFLKNFIDSGTIEKIKKILVYSETNKIGLPTFIAYSIADKAPEVMFMLLYRIYIRNIKDNLEELKPKVLGVITLFMWLGRGQKQRDHAKLLENIWPCVKDFETKRFWSNETVQRAMLMDGDFEILTPFPNLRDLKKIIPKKGLRITELTFNKIYNTNYGYFIDKMFYNKDLILYAQRETLSNWFSAIEEFSLEDTNRPFDWDHICPNNYVSGKQRIHQALKDWYISNGNYRAWEYSLNRIDQDDAPSDKLNPTSQENIDWWSKRLNKDYSTEKKLRDELLKMSFCDIKWLKLNSDIKKKIKENKTAKDIIDCILNRNIKICLEWYDKLKINELFPEIPINNKAIKSSFENIMHKKWKGEKEGDERYAYYLSIGVNNLYLYFSFNIDCNTLKENETQFGLYKNDNDTFGRIIIPKDKEDSYNQTYPHHIYSELTLISYSENSIISLFKEFNIWVNKFPNKKIRDSAIEKFNGSIKSKYKNKICSQEKQSTKIL